MRQLFTIAFAVISFAVEAVMLESQSLRINFGDPDVGFAIKSVEVLVGGGAKFIDDAVAGPSFWSLTFQKVGDINAKVTVDNLTKCRNRRVEKIADGMVFVWEGVDLPEEIGAVNVRAKVRVDSDGESHWSLECRNVGAKYALLETKYPILRSVAASGEADLLLPRMDLGARLLRNCKWTKNGYGFGCMGYFPMMTAFFVGKAGLYFAAHDSQARIKTLSIAKDNGLSFSTPVENAGVAGKAAEGPRYEVTVAALEGDWWSAAKRYRKWALTAPWTAKGRIIDRADYPRRMAEIPLWINTHAYPAEVSNTMVRARQLFPNHEVGLHWHLWQHSGHDVNYPEYFPEQPGTRECLAFCQSIGTEAMPYTNGRLWSANLASFPLVSEHALTDPNGKPYIERYGTLTPPLAPMCPYTKAWDDTLNGFCTKVLELGAKSIFLDQIGAAGGIRCYNPRHGHPLGGGTWYFDGYQALLSKNHDRYSAKGAFVTTEGSGETWMNVIDGYLQVTQRQPDDVPFFHAVYSGYTTYFCSPENHEDDDNSFWAAQAREVVWGQALGWYHPLILENAEKCALVRRLTEFRQDNLDCFAYGSLEGEVEFTNVLPQQEVVWLGRKQFYMWKVKDAPLTPTIKGSLPAVVGYRWRSAKNGKEAIAIANLTDASMSVGFMLEGSERKLELPPRGLTMIRED